MTSPPLQHLSLVYDFLANGTLGDRLLRGGGGGGGGCTAAYGDCSGGGGGGSGEESRGRRRSQEPLRSADLVRIVKDVVDGMLYLHEVRCVMFVRDLLKMHVFLFLFRLFACMLVCLFCIFVCLLVCLYGVRIILALVVAT